MIYEKCDMAREFIKLGFPLKEIKDWVCMVESESSYHTCANNKEHPDGSWDWGLFQINDMYWCNPPGRSGFTPMENRCDSDCETLLSNLKANARCAQKVKREHGFKDWEGWSVFCEGKNFDLSDCNIPEMNLHGKK